jgi:superfamily II DNA/RNA helicase
LLKSREFPGPKILVISPTRELANQIKDVLETLKHSQTEFNHATLYGGQKNFYEQKQQLERNPDVVIGTPGRIKAMLENGKFNAENLETIVLDEADVLLEIGFDKDILEIHQKIMEQKNKEALQVICFSATFDQSLNSIL